MQDGDYCTSDSYCVTAYYRYFYRGACTVQGWGKKAILACPQTQCFQTSDFRSNSVAVVACNDTAFACGEVGDAARYCEEGPVFRMGPAAPGLEFYSLGTGSQSTHLPSATTSQSAAPSSKSSMISTGDPICNTKSDSAAVIGLASAFGLLTLATLILALLLWRNTRRLRKPGGKLKANKTVLPGDIMALGTDRGVEVVSNVLGRSWEENIRGNGGHLNIAELSATRPPQEMMGRE